MATNETVTFRAKPGTMAGIVPLGDLRVAVEVGKPFSVPSAEAQRFDEDDQYERVEPTGDKDGQPTGWKVIAKPKPAAKAAAADNKGADAK